MPDILGRLKTPRLSAAPATPTVGEQYYNTTNNILYWWNGTAWIASSLPARLSDPPGAVANLDTCDVTGWYYFGTTAIGAPLAGWYGYVQVYAYLGSLQTVQIAYMHGSSDIFYRVKPGGASAPWIHLFDGNGNLVTGINTPEWVTAAGMQANSEGFWSQRDAANKVAFAAWVGTAASGDQFDRWEALASGQLQWGDGAHSPDTNLYRLIAGALMTDGEFYVAKDFAANYGQSGQVFVPPYAAPTIEFGPARDTSIQRVGANHLLTTGDLDANGQLSANYGKPAQIWLHPNGGIYFGSAADAALSHPSSGVLAVSGDFNIPGNLLGGGRVGEYCKYPANMDLNLARSNGWWMVSAGLNTPGGGQGWWMCQVICHNDIWTTQRAWDFTAPAGSQIWERRQLNGVWGAWQVWPTPSGGGAGSTELAYVERTTAFQTSMTEGQIFITAPSITFDGATRILIEAYVPGSTDSGGNAIYMTLYDNGANIGRISQHPRGGTMDAKRYLTPPAGAHVYSTSLWTGYADPPSSGPSIYLGPGGSAAFAPAFLRITK